MKNNLKLIRKKLMNFLPSLLKVDDISISITTEFKGKGSVEEKISNNKKILHIVLGVEIKFENLVDAILYHIAEKYKIKFSTLKEYYQQLGGTQK